MNNDLISRSELKKALHNFFDGKVIDEPTYILRDVFCYIDNAPTVDAIVNTIEVRPQGEWIDYDNTFYKCPDCGYLLEKCCPQCQNKVILPKGGAE